MRDHGVVGDLITIAIMVVLLWALVFAFKAAAEYEVDRYGPAPEWIE